RRATAPSAGESPNRPLLPAPMNPARRCRLRGQPHVQVPIEDASQSFGLLLDGLLGPPTLVEPGDRELVALPRPRPTDNAADYQRVGLAGHEVTPRRRGDVDVLGARTDHPLVVPRKEP